jgi:16S rRNA (cytosine1402-N4)-methyltransferase
MAVNREVESLRSSLEQALELVAPGGRIAVISYQSIEDAIVKNMFRRAAKGCECTLPPDECLCTGQPRIKALHRRVITPAPEEIAKNARSRSAKLRVVERI